MDIKIVIEKSARILKILDQEQILHSFPIGIGRNEIGAKQKSGDGRTPEGEYQICVKNPNSKFFLSLGLNYPNKVDAQYGLNSGLITASEYQAIIQRQQEDGGSNWNTSLGGAVYIHGELEAQAWSEGCIRLFNKDMQVVYDFANIRTPVRILP